MNVFACVFTRAALSLLLKPERVHIFLHSAARRLNISVRDAKAIWNLLWKSRQKYKTPEDGFV